LEAECALSRAYPLRQRIRVMLVMVTVLPESLRAFWAAAQCASFLEPGLRRSCVMSVSSEADPEGIRGWCGSRLRWRSPSARRLHQTVRTGDFADATAATGAYGHAAVAWKPLVGNHASRSGP
jgi:hypothetical protein